MINLKELTSEQLGLLFNSKKHELDYYYETFKKIMDEFEAINKELEQRRSK